MESQKKVKARVEKKNCVSCQSSKAGLQCVGCNEPVCKHCAQFVDESTFSFLEKLPGDLAAGSYCIQCHALKVQPEQAAYDEKIAQAHTISIYMKNQGKEVTALKRAQFPVTVENCEDRDETLLRLAFLTAEEGYDTLIGVEILAKKIRIDSYQKSVWNGTGVPAKSRKKKEPRT